MPSTVTKPQVKTKVFCKQTADLHLCCYLPGISPSASKHYIGRPEPLLKYFCRGRRFRGYLLPPARGVLSNMFTHSKILEVREPILFSILMIVSCMDLNIIDHQHKIKLIIGSQLMAAIQKQHYLIKILIFFCKY